MGVSELTGLFPGALEEMWKEEQRERMERNGRKQVRWPNLLAFTARQKNNHNYNYCLSNIPLSREKERSTLEPA